MKKYLLLLINLIFFSVSLSAQDDMPANKFMPNEILIKINKAHQELIKLNISELKFGLKDLDIQNQNLNLIEIEPIGNYRKTASFRLVFENNLQVEDIIKAYKNLKSIQYVEPNHIGEAGGYEIPMEMIPNPNDTYFNLQWALNNDGSFNVSGMNMQVTAGADINILDAWDIETGDPDMVIAVSDSGMRMNHEDIIDNLWVNPNEVEDGTDSDGNGYVDDIHGWNWINNSNNPEDDHGHGTNCAGIISATSNNAKGYTGVNWNSKTMTLKVLNNNNQGSYADMSNSIYYAVDNGAKIISMSIGGAADSAILSDAVSYAESMDVILVACMMNFNNQITYYPAGYSLTHDNVIAVGATDADDTRSQPFFWSLTSGSNYGNHINVVAPGNYIYSLGIGSNSSYANYWGGTSQATPHVAGIASLVWAVNPSLSPLQVRQIIEDTAEDQVGKANEDTAGFDIYYGWGRVNAHAAVVAARALSVEDHKLVENKLSLINPVRNQKLEFYSNLDFVGQAHVMATSLDGRKVLDTKTNVVSGQNYMYLTDLTTGSYMLRFEIGDYKKTFKIIIQ